MMRVSEFARAYGLKENSMDVFVWNNKDKKFIVNIGGRIYVDNKLLEKMQTLRKRVWNKAHELYYEISESGISDSEQARTLCAITGKPMSTWTSFLNMGMWTMMRESITAVDRREKLEQYLLAAGAILLVMDKHGYTKTEDVA